MKFVVALVILAACAEALPRKFTWNDRHLQQSRQGEHELKSGRRKRESGISCVDTTYTVTPESVQTISHVFDRNDNCTWTVNVAPEYQQEYVVIVLLEFDSPVSCPYSSLFLNDTNGENIVELCQACTGPIASSGPIMFITYRAKDSEPTTLNMELEAIPRGAWFNRDQLIEQMERQYYCVVRDPDICNSAPCGPGETCHISSGRTFYCISACDEYTCFPGSTCVPEEDGSSFTCLCPPGSTGRYCENNPCHGYPCMPGSTCVPEEDASSFTCLCPPGVTGHYCENGDAGSYSHNGEGSTTTAPALKRSCTPRKDQVSRVEELPAVLVSESGPEGLYPNHLCQAWTIMADQGQCIYVNVSDGGFKTERGYDFVTFKDSNGSVVQRTGTISTGVKMFESQTNRINVTLTTDYSIRDDGFTLDVKSVPCAKPNDQ